MYTIRQKEKLQKSYKPKRKQLKLRQINNKASTKTNKQKAQRAGSVPSSFCSWSYSTATVCAEVKLISGAIEACLICADEIVLNSTRYYETY